jgi:hypothetical protein
MTVRHHQMHGAPSGTAQAQLPCQQTQGRMGPGMMGGGMMDKPMGQGMMGGGMGMGMRSGMGGGMMAGSMEVMPHMDHKTVGEMMQLRGKYMKEMGELMEKRGKEIEAGK